MTSWFTLLLGAVCLMILADLLIHIVYSFMALNRFETLPTFRVLPPPQDAPLLEPVEFPTTNQLKLSGGVYFPEDGHPRGVILFCPETGGSFDTAMNYAEALVEAGFAVVSFSFRNQYPSETLSGYRSNYWVTQYEVDDVHAALDFIELQPQFLGLPIGVMGVSRGAGAALAGGSARPEVAQVWSEGGFSSSGLAMHHALKFVQTMVGPLGKLIPQWHVQVTIWFMLRLNEYRNRCRLINLESMLPRWQLRDVMFVSGARDTYVPTSLAENLCRLTGHDTKSSLWIVPQAKHNLERATAPREFDQRLVQFFERMVPREHQLTGAKECVAEKS